MSETSIQIQPYDAVTVLRLCSDDETNRLTYDCIVSLTDSLCRLTGIGSGLIITGNSNFFSSGAELKEIAALTAPAGYEFARTGHRLMEIIASFPVPVYAAVSGYCMGGGLDLALACHHRIAAPHAVFGHRGAALGLITGWGGTQRLPRLLGKGQTLAMLVAADKIDAAHALRIGLIDAIAEDPVAEAGRRLQK